MTFLFGIEWSVVGYNVHVQLSMGVLFTVHVEVVEIVIYGS